MLQRGRIGTPMGDRLLLGGWRGYWRRALLLLRHMVSDDSQSVNKKTLTRAKRNQLRLHAATRR
jgi:hypothetical protein